MNILIFSWRGPGHPHAGGAEVATHEDAKGWVKKGHNVTLFTSDYPGSKDEEIIDGVRIIRSGSQIFGVHIEACQWYIKGKHLKYDLVIDQFHGIPFFTPLYIKEKKLAFIHEVTKEVWGLNPWPAPFNLIPAFFGTLLEPYLFKIFYRNIPFMTGAESTKKDLIDWGIPQENISVISYGVSVPKVKIFPKEEKNTLIFLGALSKDKGIEDALKIFSIVSGLDNDFSFWVVGKGEDHYTQKLKLLAIKLGIDKRVKFWGYVSQQKKFELLGRAHLLVNPSVREGWGLVVIEAASVGTPSVGYNVVGLKDSILNDKTGILCDPNPVDSSKAILSLLGDKKKYNSFRKNCLKWSNKFSWERSSKESLELIGKIVESD